MQEKFIVIRIPTKDSWMEATLVKGKVTSTLYTPFRDEDVERCTPLGLSFRVSQEFPDTVISCDVNYEVVRKFDIYEEEASE